MGAPLAPVLYCGSLALTVALSLSLSLSPASGIGICVGIIIPSPSGLWQLRRSAGGVSTSLISAEVNGVARIQSKDYPYTEENVLNSSGLSIGCLCSLSLSWTINACACGDSEIIR
jgi:hypothetical protein